MENASINYFVLAIGALPILFGGLSLYVRWLNPRSRLEPAFRARWRGGKEASDLGAATQVFGFLAIGIFMVLFGLFGSGRFVEYWQYVVYLAVAVMGLAFLLEG